MGTSPIFALNLKLLQNFRNVGRVAGRPLINDWLECCGIAPLNALLEAVPVFRLPTAACFQSLDLVPVRTLVPCA